MHRYSVSVKIGRIYQAVSPALWFLDYPFRLPYAFNKSKSLPAIFILAPPRSGSTLLYQLLIEAFHNVHLTNLQNLLFSTPMLGSFLSDWLCNKQRANFQSIRGFVPGMCGEAEGMKFWKYWMGQGLQPDNSRLKPSRLNKVKALLSKRYSSKEMVWISGYIGHVFCIDFLREYWPNAVFIHLYRDLVSNAYSLYRSSPNRWFSLNPGGIQNVSRDRYEEITRQIIRIHSIILDYYGKDMFSLSYGELCETPHQVIKQIIDFASKNDIVLREKNPIPRIFENKVVDWDLNIHTQVFYQYLKEETSKYKGHKKQFFGKLIV
ncbi:MAG: sulfotransferase [Bacteroidota bacterium]